MKIFRRKPKCPICGRKDHIGLDYHQQRLEEAESKIPQLQAHLRSLEDSRAPKRLLDVAEDVLISAVVDRDMERLYIDRAHATT